MEKPIITQVREEQAQGHVTRQELYRKIEAKEGRPVISFFTSFIYQPALIDDWDADMMEAVLHKCNLSKGFILLLSSPGGYGLSAERIIRICRSNDSGKYDVVVPGKAKSAATMICFGANKIIMGKTSELGPIDPQISIVEKNQLKNFSVYNLVKSYEELFKRATKEKGNLEPYLQQLSNYDERQIAEFRRGLELSNDIAVKSLKSGMLSNWSEKKIIKEISTFLTPEDVKTHGRPIYAEEAKKHGLNVEIRDFKKSNEQEIFELYIRLNNYVSTDRVLKCIESEHHSYLVRHTEG